MPDSSLDRSPEQRPRLRKSPSQARSQETVRTIVEGAARVLERRGRQGFSTNAVAVEAGVSVGSLYQYFPSKEALVGALIVRETSLLIADAHAAGGAASGPEALSALITACIAHQFRRPRLARLLDFEEARLPFDADVQRVDAEFRAILLDVLARDDLPASRNPDATARDVMAIAKGMIDAAGVAGECEEPDLADRVRRAVFGYLWGPAPARDPP